MTLVAKNYTSEAGHWYTKDGIPAYTVIGKNGKERNTTLRDAREHSLVPSVTTIIGVAAKHGLTAWLQKQAILAALTLPRLTDEPEEEWLDRVLQDSKQQGRDAADAGTDIHAAIQASFEGKDVGRHQEHVKAVHEALLTHFGDVKWVAERSFAHDLGFGGKSDLFCPEIPAVVDIKSKDFTDPEKVDAYDEHMMQLAAYRVGLGAHKAVCSNLFVSRTVPGLTVFKHWTEAEIARGWTMFANLLEFWQAKNKYR
jgi:hypothetical protein